MARFAAVFAMLSAGTLSIGGCEGGRDSSGSSYGYTYAACQQYASCEACTPVLGCGWCDKDDGTGMCADDPNDCATSTSFRWTWEPTGCRVTAEAGVNVSDAASE